jgi:hypothetical protein
MAVQHKLPYKPIEGVRFQRCSSANLPSLPCSSASVEGRFTNPNYRPRFYGDFLLPFSRRAASPYGLVNEPNRIGGVFVESWMALEWDCPSNTLVQIVLLPLTNHVLGGIVPVEKFVHAPSCLSGQFFPCGRKFGRCAFQQNLNLRFSASVVLKE